MFTIEHLFKSCYFKTFSHNYIRKFTDCGLRVAKYSNLASAQILGFTTKTLFGVLTDIYIQVSNIK